MPLVLVGTWLCSDAMTLAGSASAASWRRTRTAPGDQTLACAISAPASGSRCTGSTPGVGCVSHGTALLKLIASV